MCQVVQDVLHKLKSQGLSVHFPAAFWEHVPVAGTVPPCEEDRVPMDPDCDCTSCYYPESMVVVLRGGVFIHCLQDLIKDCPKWSVDCLICVCISRLHHHHGDAGIIAVLTDVLSYSSRPWTTWWTTCTPREQSHSRRSFLQGPSPWSTSPPWFTTLIGRLTWWNPQMPSNAGTCAQSIGSPLREL